MRASEQVKKELIKKAKPEKKEVLERFFKTGKGEYGEGDVFLGVMVPDTRGVVKRFKGLMLKDIQELLLDEFHEVRLCGFLLLVQKYEEEKKKNNDSGVREVVGFYLKNLEKANNWDLVDLSCYKILGDYLVDKEDERKVLYELARSKNMWGRRTSIVSTLALIRNNELRDVFALSELLLRDEEDLMHKAVGWMLREAGKRDEAKLKKFLERSVKRMPRTTLRYAIEKFSEEERRRFLKI